MNGLGFLLVGAAVVVVAIAGRTEAFCGHLREPRATKSLLAIVAVVVRWCVVRCTFRLACATAADFDEG